MKFTAIVSAALILTLLVGCQNGTVQETPAPGAESPSTQQGSAPPSQPDAPVSTDSTTITREQATQIALTHAGLTADQVRGLETDADWDNGELHYEVEFHSGGYEYDYEISAGGAILRHNKEFD